MLRDHASSALEDAEVCCGSCAETVQLCGGVDANEDDVGLGNRLSDACGECEVGCPLGDADGAQTRQIDHCGIGAVAGDPHNLGETVLVDRQVGRAPCRALLLAQVDYVDNNLRVVVCNESSSRATWRSSQ